MNKDWKAPTFMASQTTKASDILAQINDMELSLKLWKENHDSKDLEMNEVRWTFVHGQLTLAKDKMKILESFFAANGNENVTDQAEEPKKLKDLLGFPIPEK